VHLTPAFGVWCEHSPSQLALANTGMTHLCCVQHVQVSYAIGVAEPLSIHVDTYATAKEGVNDKQILAAVKKAFDFRPGACCVSAMLCATDSLTHS